MSKKRVPRSNVRAAGNGGYRHTDIADIPPEKLTEDERAVLAAIVAHDELGVPVHISEVGAEVFKGRRGLKMAPVRYVINALRRLVAGRYVKRVDGARGCYAPDVNANNVAPVIAATERPKVAKARAKAAKAAKEEVVDLTPKTVKSPRVRKPKAKTAVEHAAEDKGPPPAADATP